MPIVTGEYARALDVAAFLALDGGAWRVNLYTNVYTPVPTSVPGDFTSATYAGYAAQPTGGWGSPVIDGLGNARCPGLTSLSWQPTAMTALPQTCHGWYVDDGAGHFLFGDELPSPFIFVDTNSLLVLVPSYSVGELV